MRILPHAPTSDHTITAKPEFFCLVMDRDQWQYLYDLLAEESDWRATLHLDDETPAIAALYDEVQFIESRRRLGSGEEP